MTEALPYAVAVGDWLPYSETFIYDQLRCGRRFHAHVLARGRDAAWRLFPWPDVTALRFGERLFYYQFRRSFRFRRALERSGARFIHAHFGTNGALVVPMAHSMKLPLAVSFHGVDVGVLMGKVPSDYRFYERIYRDVFDEARWLLPASQELADCLLELGAPAEKIRIHRLGVNLKVFQAVTRPERPIRFLMIGRLVEKKGFDDGIRAFARIAGKYPQATLTLVGRGPQRKMLQNLAESFGLGGRIRFAGVIPASRMPDVLAEHDVLLAPCVVARNNDRDSGLIVLKEAGATAMPSVGTICGGLPEIIENGQTGYLVPQHAVEEMAESLDVLARDPDLRLRLGMTARAKMEREYDSVIQNERLEELFQTLL